jgi:hypothetical protein
MKHASMGGADAWPAAKYLNLWVCHLAGLNLGYAGGNNVGIRYALVWLIALLA